MRTFAIAALVALAQAGADPHPGDTVHFDGQSSTEVAFNLIAETDYLINRDDVHAFLKEIIISPTFIQLENRPDELDALYEAWEQIGREYMQTSRRLIALYADTVANGSSRPTSDLSVDTIR